MKHLRVLPADKYILVNNQPFFHLFYHVRPIVDFSPKRVLKRCFTESEDNLLAHGLDTFHYLEDQRTVYSLIHENFLPTRTAKQIMIRVKNNTSRNSPANVLKHWKETGQIKYDINLTVAKVMKALSVSDPEHFQPISVKNHNLDWLLALREQRSRLKRDLSRHRMKCTKVEILQVSEISTLDPSHNHEVSFLMKAKNDLLNDVSTHFNTFKILAESNRHKGFDCNEVVMQVIHELRNYPTLKFEFISIFSPLPDLPVNKLSEVFGHVQIRMLLRSLEEIFLHSK